MASDPFAGNDPPLRMSAVKSLPLDVSGGDQTLSQYSDAFLCTGNGNVVGKLRDDSTDRTFAVLAGYVYPLCFKFIEQTNTTATGIFLFLR